MDRKKSIFGQRFCKVAAAAVLTAAALPLAGCSLAPSTQLSQEETEEEFANLISVGFSQIGSESRWRTANTVSMQDALTTENGFFLLFNNARQKQENQIKAIRSFVSQRVDYIVFSPIVETGWDTVLTEAKEAGIPVIVIDRKAKVEEEDLYAAWIGSDTVREGEKAGEWLEAQVSDDEQINIVVLAGTEGASAAEGRSEGFHRISRRHDNWNILEELGGDFTTARGRETMQALIEKYPDIDVVVSQNDDMTFGAIEAMEEAGMQPGSDPIVISFDAVREALELVEQGKINADVEDNPLLGPYVQDLILKMEEGEDYDRETAVDEMVFTKENVSRYLESRAY